MEEIEDKYFSIEVLKNGSNRHLRYNRKPRINPSNPIIVDYKSPKSYFEDHQSYDRAQKSLAKAKKETTEEDYSTDV